MTPPQPPLRLGWLSTGRGPGSRRLLSAACEAIHRGELAARIQLVLCNREPGEAEGSDEFLRLVQCRGLPLITLSSRRFRRERAQTAGREWRVAYDAELLRRLAPHPLDLLVLAGYMLILGEPVCRAYPSLNLHPALPGGPLGTWQEVIWQLMAQGARESGVMVHLATPEVDQGPVVTFCRFPIRGGAFDSLWHAVAGVPIEQVRAQEGDENALFRLIREEGVKREIPLLIATLQSFADGRLRVAGGQVVNAAGAAVHGDDLSAEIEAAAQAGGPA